MPPLWVLAVMVSVMVSCFTVVGMAMQSAALRNAEDRERYAKVGELVMSPLWFLGVMLQVLPNFLGDFIAYAIAPISLTAPLSGVSVVINTSLAPRLLGEKLHRWPDLPATTLILIGVVMTTSTGAHEDKLEVSELGMAIDLVVRPLFLATLLVIATSVLFCLYREVYCFEEGQSFEAPNLLSLLVPAWSAAAMGCMTNIFLKVFAEIATSHEASVLQVIAVMLVLTPCALLQQQALSRGLRLYPQTMFFPVYSSLLVLTNSLVGSIFFEEYMIYVNSAARGSTFASGCLLVMVGISLFRYRKVVDSKDGKEAFLATEVDSRL